MARTREAGRPEVLRRTVALRAIAVVTIVCLPGSCSVFLPFQDIEETGAERCSNDIDDDLDSLVDCEDPDCDGYCPEESPVSCSNGRDDDGDGAVDYEEVICWPHSDVVVGCDGRAPRSSSVEGSVVALGPTEGWSFTCFDVSDCSPWVPSPTGDSDELALRLRGAGHDCRELAGCEYAMPPRSNTGGPCWQLEADVLLEPGSALAFVFTPSEAASPPLRHRDAAIVGVALESGPGGVPRARVSFRGDGRHLEAHAPTAGGWHHLRIATRGGGRSCHAPEYGPISVSLAGPDSDETLLQLEPMPVPSSWRPEAPVSVSLIATGTGAGWVRDLTLMRTRYDPCGHPIPQVTGVDEGPAVVLAAARGGGRVCALGATTTSPQPEREYVPTLHQGTPPELGEDAPPFPRRSFAAWHAQDEGARSFTGAILGPVGVDALRDESVRAAALMWNEGAERFEGIVLVSTDPRRGGRLVWATSPDCESWGIEPVEGLPDQLASAHPVLLDPTRLVLALPGEAYSETLDGAPCPEHQPCAQPADQVPYIRAFASNCMRWPRAALFEARARGPARFAVGPEPLGALPTFERFWITCGNWIGAAPAATPRSYPVQAHQLLERGGFRAYLGTGRAGIEVAIGGTVEPRDADALLLPQPLLGPSGLPGTFDAARVSEPHLLLFDDVPGCPLDGLLFYRGFESVESDEAGIIRAHGGRVGVVPVRFDSFGRGYSEIECPTR